MAGGLSPTLAKTGEKGFMNRRNRTITQYSYLLYHGTLVCCLTTKENIYLYSDGRVTKDGQIVSQEFSKVHKVTKFVGMLTAGMHLEPFKPNLVENCSADSIDHIDGVAGIASTLLSKIWDANAQLMDRREKEEKMRVFIFLAGYTHLSEPKLYYLDSVSHPRFLPQQRCLFTDPLREIEIAGLVSDESNDNPSNLMGGHVQSMLQKYGLSDLKGLFLASFDRTKEEINARNDRIGGRTFCACIDPMLGYYDIL